MNIEAYLEHLEKCKHLQEKDVKLICQKAKQILADEPNMKQVRAPVTICGDIHGQFYDLLELFQIGGKLPVNLIQQNYVDRGFNSVETFSYVLCLKIKCPQRITLLRGNHENKQINKLYGFHEQCQKKYYTQNVWRLFSEVFEYLPLAATIQNKIFCLHGGLSPQLGELRQINPINRFRQIPHNGTMCDMLWSDPEPDLDKKGFQQSPRGAGYVWGSDITQKFNHTNDLMLVCRAHQLMMQGYLHVHKDKCLTVFSAPNYCYRCGNQASIVEVDDKLSFNMHQYDPAPRQTEPETVKRVPAYFL